MKVGEKFWSFDGNRRHYEGTGSGAKIIYRDHFFPVEIMGKTSRSWIVGTVGGKCELFKVPKRDPLRQKHGPYGARPMIFTDQMVDDECYAIGHRHKIVRQIERITNASTLRQVAELIDYKGGT